jgi:hypothetical protein
LNRATKKILIWTLAVVLPTLAISPSLAGNPQKGVSAKNATPARAKKISTEPFSVVYSITQSDSSKYKQYMWSDGLGNYRIENELPYAKIDGVTDVVFEDYGDGKRFTVNTLFKSVEVSNLGKFSLPTSDAEFKGTLKATPLGEKTIAGFRCKGWTYKNGELKHEVWICPELKWYLEHKMTGVGGTLVCKAEKAVHKRPPIEMFTLPREFKYVDTSENAQSDLHHHHH